MVFHEAEIPGLPYPLVQVSLQFSSELEPETKQANNIYIYLAIEHIPNTKFVSLNNNTNVDASNSDAL